MPNPETNHRPQGPEVQPEQPLDPARESGDRVRRIEGALNREQSSWQQGEGYQRITLENGTKYAVYDNGHVRSWAPETNTVEDVADVSSLPDIVREKLWKKGKGYRWTVLEDGQKFAVYENGGIRSWSSETGLKDMAIVSECPPLVQKEWARMRQEHEAPATPEQVTETTNTQNPTAREVIARLRALRFVDKDGNAVQVNERYIANIARDETHFLRHGIPDAKLGQYLRNAETGAGRMQEYLRGRSVQNGVVEFDGSSFIFWGPRQENGTHERVIANALYLLQSSAWSAGNSTEYLCMGGDLRGKRITVIPQGGVKGNDCEYRYNEEYGRQVSELVGVDGSLHVRTRSERGSAPSVIEYFNGEGGSEAKRPNVLFVKDHRNGGDEVSLPTRDGEKTSEKHTLRNGIYFVPETGRPIGRFEQREGTLTPSETERARRFADYVAKTLKTPQVIAAFVTSNFDFVYQGGLYGGLVHGQMEMSGEDAQHPLRTIYRGAGDCEDYAILIQYLCRRAKELDPTGKAGCDAFVGKTYEIHNSAYYIEEYSLPTGEKRYALCQMHTVGFERHTTDKDGKNFTTPQAALRAVWKNRGASYMTGVDAEIDAIHNDIRSLHSRGMTPENTQLIEQKRAYATTLEQVRNEGGGVIVLEKDSSLDQRNVLGSEAQEGVIGFNDKDERGNSIWSRYVKKIS
jgi:hypothetical protein